MTQGQGVSRFLVLVLVVSVALAGGCGSDAPYRVSEPRTPTAAQLRRLGRIELAALPAGGNQKSPRVYIGVPDRRAEGAASGAVLGGVAGAIIGGVAASPGSGLFAEIAILQGAALGAIIGAPVGGAVGAALGTPGKGARKAARKLRRVAQEVDVAAAARDGATRPSRLARIQQSPTSGPGGVISIEVIAYGTRAAGGGRARPFVAIRTRLTEAGTGRVVYQSTADWRGTKRQFYQWAEGGAAAFRAELEDAARKLGNRSVNRALTPRAR